MPQMFNRRTEIRYYFNYRLLYLLTYITFWQNLIKLDEVSRNTLALIKALSSCREINMSIEKNSIIKKLPKNSVNDTSTHTATSATSRKIYYPQKLYHHFILSRQQSHFGSSRRLHRPISKLLLIYFSCR